MAIQTCEVFCQLLDQSGEPIDGARISARLMEASVGGGQVQLPDLEYSVTNARGECTLVLTPNNLSGNPGTYTFEIQAPGGRPRYFKGIKVPSVASVTLAELLGWVDEDYRAGAIQIQGSTVLLDGHPIVMQ